MNPLWVDQLNITFLKMICKKWTAYECVDQKTQVFKSIGYYKLLMHGAIKKEIFFNKNQSNELLMGEPIENEILKKD